MGKLKYRHMMNKHKPQKNFHSAFNIFFDTGFNSCVVNKHSAKKELSAPMECFDFKFSGTEGDGKKSQFVVFDTLRAVARESR